MRYWIDTDPGLDDALAILLAVRSVGTALVGLSSVQGNGDEPLVANNLLRALAKLEQMDLLPPGWAPALARGAREPLTGGPPRRAFAYHGPDCLGGLDWPVPDAWKGRFGTAPAAVAIVEAARIANDLHIVCLGPLTNLALALHLEPELPRLVSRLTVMGGSLRAGGNQTPAAEFNFIADPDAASLVLKAGFPRLGLVPIDVCDDARLLATDIGTLRSLGTPAAEVVLALLQFSTGGGIPAAGVPFYDPTAWLLARQPDLSIWEQHYLVVDAGQGEGRGASIADWRGSARKAPNAQVGMRLADRQAFLHTFFNILEHPRY